MKRVFQNSTLSIDYDEEQSLIIQHWVGAMDEKSYMENMCILAEWISKLPHPYYNIVYPNLDFPITPDLQEWTKNILFLPLHHKLQKIAFIVPQSVFDELNIEFLSIEQLMDENMDLFSKRYFVFEKDVYQWFKESI